MFHYLIIVLSVFSTIHCEISSAISYNDKPLSTSNETVDNLYQIAVDSGIINTEKYPLESFVHDEEEIFRNAYEEYNSLNGTKPLTYEDWLILNNFGILPDTQESLFQRKLVKRSTADNKRRFVNVVKRGDILVTGRGVGGLIGHAAIMISDNYVLEMQGGKNLKSNNKKLSKHNWFDRHARDWTTVYRCPNRGVANAAAAWAIRNYWNPRGGQAKTIHINYKIDLQVYRKNPSYCSKLVIQAYYFGTGSKKVIGGLRLNKAIMPTAIPSFFLRPYNLQNKGKY